MLISTTLAAELLLLSAASDQLTAALRQDAVLVSYDRVARGSQTTLCVSTPISSSEGGPVSLDDLRSMVAVTEQAVRSPRFEIMVDNTIGGISWEQYKQAAADAGEGGIAGAPVEPFNLRLLLASGSIVPPSQLEGLTDALEDVEQYFEQHIDSFNVTVTLRVAYVPITAGRLGFTTARYSIEKYSDVADAIDRTSLNELEETPVPVRPTIPIRYSGVSTAVTQENRVFVTRPLKMALGLPEAGGISAPTDDGTISLNSAIQWDFNPQDGVRVGTTYLYSFQDHLVREVAQAMGFVAGADFLVRDCTVMDLFRFQADAIDPTYVIAPVDDVFGGPPMTSCDEFEDEHEENLLNGALTPEIGALDYNPGLSKTLIENWEDLHPCNTANQLLGAATVAVGDLPDPLEFLQHQLAGNPGFDTNVFDDADILPAIPAAQRTIGYPDGAVQTIATVETRSDAYVELRGPAGAPLAGFFVVVIGDNDSATPPLQNGRIESVVALEGSIGASGVFLVAESTYPFGRPDQEAVLNFEDQDNLTFFLVEDFTGVDGQLLDTDFDGILERGERPWIGENDSVALVSTATPDGTTSDFVYSETRVGPAGETSPAHIWRCSDTDAWKVGVCDPADVADTSGAANPTCEGGAIGGGTVKFNEIRVKFNTERCAVIDFRAKVPAVADPVVAQLNLDFRGAMPRTVARNTVANSAILNFMVDTTGNARDFEFEVYDGSPIRGAFIKQNELADLGTRCLMGKEIGRGNTFYSRDPCSYTLSPLDMEPLGEFPDFLTRREWLALDLFGWAVDIAELDGTDEGDTSVNLSCEP